MYDDEGDDWDGVDDEGGYRVVKCSFCGESSRGDEWIAHHSGFRCPECGESTEGEDGDEGFVSDEDGDFEEEETGSRCRHCELVSPSDEWVEEWRGHRFGSWCPLCGELDREEW